MSDPAPRHSANREGQPSKPAAKALNAEEDADFAEEYQYSGTDSKNWKKHPGQDAIKEDRYLL